MPRRDTTPTIREEYISEEIVTAKHYYIDYNESNRISINTNVIEPIIVTGNITSDSWYNTTNDNIKILTEKMQLTFLKRKAMLFIKK